MFWRFVFAFILRVIALAPICINPGSWADFVSTGEAGINSRGLGLTGQGISLGQLEGRRPGKHGFEAAGNICSAYDPFAVFTVNQAPIVNFTELHAVQVAGVMIADPAIAATLPNPDVISSVSRGATLYATTNTDAAGNTTPSTWILAAQHIATENQGQVRAINCSIGDFGVLDGSSPITLGLDWIVREYDVLFCQARANLGSTGLPDDIYNGLVTASTELINGVFDTSSLSNDTTNAINGRRLTLLLAPGVELTVTDYDNPPGQVSVSVQAGTSLASPHSAGSVMLLQEHAEAQISASAANWNANSNRHQVMKAVLMNSADKLEDTGDGTRICMEKLILDHIAALDWTETDAYTGLNADALPLADHLGVGQLNAKRALKQFESGERNYGTASYGSALTLVREVAASADGSDDVGGE